MGLQIISWDSALEFRNKEKEFGAPGVHNLLLLRLIINNEKYRFTILGCNKKI